MKEVEKVCKHHGLTSFRFEGVAPEGNDRYRCRKCSSASTKKNRAQMMQRVLEYKGSKCEICGYNKSKRALQFHHLDPSKKDFNISMKDLGKTWETIKAELDKCVLLCGNCHAEEHEKLDALQTNRVEVTV